jgi:hypothetical protein
MLQYFVASKLDYPIHHFQRVKVIAGRTGSQSMTLRAGMSESRRDDIMVAMNGIIKTQAATHKNKSGDSLSWQQGL